MKYILLLSGLFISCLQASFEKKRINLKNDNFKIPYLPKNRNNIIKNENLNDYSESNNHKNSKYPQVSKYAAWHQKNDRTFGMPYPLHKYRPRITSSK